MLPNFLIVGASKAGTTSLHEYLRAHPEVFMATPKELNFFSFDDRWGWGLGWYERQFRHAAGALAVGEASPSYAETSRRSLALRRIAATLPGVRLVFLARHPIARAMSSYRHVVAEGHERRPIDEVLVEGSDFVAQSFYWRTVQELLGSVSRDRLLALLSQHLRHDRATTLERVHRYLGVEPWTGPVIDMEFNRAVDRSPVQRRIVQRFSGLRPVVDLGRAMPTWMKPPLHAVTRRRPFSTSGELSPEQAERLIALLRDDIRAFGRFLGEDLSSWEAWPPPPGSD